MVRNVVLVLLLGVIAIVPVPAATAAAPQDPLSLSAAAALMQHRPIEPHRDEKGRSLRSIDNSFITNNWSGYAVANFQTSLY